MRTPSIIDINDVPALDDADGDAERENTIRDEEEFGSEYVDGDHPQIMYGDHDKLALVTYPDFALVTYPDVMC
ncbi:hypothetical protein D1007_47971 [Hordeum vulgare]|nr:hypothetical protein D1007_47971 [Hordeum vulgare]